MTIPSSSNAFDMRRGIFYGERMRTRGRQGVRVCEYSYHNALSGEGARGRDNRSQKTEIEIEIETEPETENRK